MHENLKIIFAGTPKFAAATLQALITSQFEVIAVYTQPDRPAGRGRKIQSSPVKNIALKSNIPIYQPEKFDDETVLKLKSLNADLMIVSAYGLLLPLEALTAPSKGCINIHASLLPRWRGAAPIQRAIIAGDTHTGITIMQMVEKLDAGPILQQSECEIYEHDTGESLHDRLSEISAKEICKAIDLLNKNKIVPIKQDETSATYANKISKREANINWNENAQVIERKIRAFNSWPVAYSFFHGERIRIWEAEVSKNVISKKPGEIIELKNFGLDVCTGEGVINLKKLQFPGGNIISANDFANSHSIINEKFTFEQSSNQIKVDA